MIESCVKSFSHTYRNVYNRLGSAIDYSTKTLKYQYIRKTKIRLEEKGRCSVEDGIKKLAISTLWKSAGLEEETDGLYVWKIVLARYKQALFVSQIKTF